MFSSTRINLGSSPGLNTSIKLACIPSAGPREPVLPKAVESLLVRARTSPATTLSPFKRVPSLSILNVEMVSETPSSSIFAFKARRCSAWVPETAPAFSNAALYSARPSPVDSSTE